ncbi:GLPGLI family protein [Mucilaginibacter xinganensis]|uniref:GLPGLI family protein n=1 Tax=Mucilaginibacter xinganensis TaxID=1234841 RepID=A0A223P2R8_9SPHI|nr:GLPGLI family protein [Mucilaginibacter xinganensis]ASU36382.1 GLPGLI family protein [Mucilaginibacter xinganensis]
MKTKIITIIGMLLLSGSMLFAQNEHFTTHGTIEFEKSVNMFATIKKWITPENESFLAPLLESYKKTQPQFKKSKSILNFTDNKTLATPVESNDADPNSFFNDEAVSGQPNTTYTDLDDKTSITQKKVYEDLYLVKDTLRKITWKITDETREIAGFTCRRANALVMDSVYVVAFYAEKIPVSGGPESFTGLPGMILGLALPHDNVTWFATKVTDMTIEPKAMTIPKKGKPVNRMALYNTLKQLMKNWGQGAKDEMKALIL